MLVLGLDTSGYVNAVGIADGEKVLADKSFSALTDTLEQIVANIDDVIKSTGLTLADIKGIGVGLGPGSWTGIRVGVTVGKMLAFSAGKPVAGVSTLALLAHAARTMSPVVYAVVGVGAGGAVYAARFRVTEASVTQEGDYYTGDVKGLASLVTETGALSATGAASYAAQLKEETGMSLLPFEATPSGAAAAVLAARRLAVRKSDDPLALIPLYLKESTAKAFVNKYAGKNFT